ncbi:unnamed protein product [Fraxinus pennsylvanica]|uniref:Heparanase-like protein 1 n=1 Tax=Fraxinus pennsylvanica TaxID=56036 RepID=A0AAD1YSJ9_9LAMI|nr:unnamed protein product [Fraxinus pennsylvanica]
MGFQISLFILLLVFSPSILAQNADDVRLVIHTNTTTAETDDNYVCATLDWWPHDKCNYNQCPWEYSSVINLDLSHPFLANAVQAFKNFRLRLGGSLQDQVLYEVGNLKSPCKQFEKDKSGLFGFSKGCLHMKRWDELNNFFKMTGAVVTFGLNALHGRQHFGKDSWQGDWDSSNAHDFIKYTITKGYLIDSWEFGNELSGKGIGASVGAEQYGKDVVRLNSIIDELYKNFQPKPIILAPGGFYDKSWFDKLLQVSGPRVVNALSHHIYNLGSGNDHNLINKILDPDHLNKVSATFGNLSLSIQMNGPWASAWVGESGGAYNSGGPHVSDTFVDSFWYLDQLGMAAKYSTKVYCRQTLIGGNYGLLNASTFVPNPDYYSALLWHRLMGKGVLDVDGNGSPYLRSYAHCSKGRAGVTLLLINLSNQTMFNVDAKSSSNVELQLKEKVDTRKRSFAHGLKGSFSWVGNKASDERLFREEYHLTPEAGNLQSRTMLLNGQALQLTERGDIPSLSPVPRDINSPITISPLSIKFIVFTNFNTPGCK